MIAATIDRIRKACRPAQRPAAASFHGLALSMAKGIEPSAEDAATILRACERTPDDLAAEVERLRQRIEALRRLEAATAAQRELPGVESSLARVNATEAEAVRRARQEREPLLVRRAKLTDAVTQATGARQRLQQTMSADQRADLAEIDAEARPLREQIDRLAEDVAGRGPGTIGYAVAKLTEQVESSRNAIARIPGPQKAHAQRELELEEQRLARFVETVEERRAQLAQVRAELRELDERRDEIMRDAMTNV